MKIEQNVFEFSVLWSQIDGNMHLRHSAYADIAAQARMQLLDSIELNAHALVSLRMGPILMREELKYLREVGLSETVRVISYVTKSNPNASRWSFRHEIFRADGKKAAVIDVDGAWIDVDKRKLAALPELYISRILTFPRSEDFVMQD